MEEVRFSCCAENLSLKKVLALPSARSPPVPQSPPGAPSSPHQPSEQSLRQRPLLPPQRSLNLALSFCGPGLLLLTAVPSLTTEGLEESCHGQTSPRLLARQPDSLVPLFGR